jgi:hypothetical protein
MHLDDQLRKEIDSKITDRGQFIDVFSDWKSVKLDGTFHLNDLIIIVEVLKNI